MAAPEMTAGKIGFVKKYSDVMIAVGIVTIVVMMIIPLPTILLDLLLCMNITLALVVVMSAIYNVEALDLSVFPSLLLITTLFRLALNVSSTRLILLEGYAGEVISSFGNFVVGGNAVVGFIIFVILIIIQFLVITKGAERVAEVSARFTLDAMPGKQMAIDADLNQGAITDAEASERRKKIQREADFYGAMDGASKFVKGDAIAAIIIIIINITGGFVIGMRALYGILFLSHCDMYLTEIRGFHGYQTDGFPSGILLFRQMGHTGINAAKDDHRQTSGNEPLGIFSHYNLLRRIKTTTPAAKIPKGINANSRNTSHWAVAPMTRGWADKLLDGMETISISGCIQDRALLRKDWFIRLEAPIRSSDIIIPAEQTNICPPFSFPVYSARAASVNGPSVSSSLLS